MFQCLNVTCTNHTWNSSHRLRVNLDFGFLSLFFFIGTYTKHYTTRRKYTYTNTYHRIKLNHVESRRAFVNNRNPINTIRQSHTQSHAHKIHLHARNIAHHHHHHSHHSPLPIKWILFPFLVIFFLRSLAEKKQKWKSTQFIFFFFFHFIYTIGHSNLFTS